MLLSVLRKATPGMSATIEAIIFPLICLALLGMVIFEKRRAKPMDSAVMILIGFVFVIYAAALLLSLQYGLKFAVVTTITRFLPLGVLLLSLRVYDLEAVFRKVVWCYFIFGMIMLPFALISMVSGSGGLPSLFAPTEVMASEGKGTRFGMPVYFGLFYSNVVLAYTYYAVGVIALFLIERELETQRRVSMLYLLTLLVAFLLVLFTSKRLALILLTSGAFLTWLKSGIKGGRMLGFVGMGLLAVLVPALVFLLARSSDFNLIESLTKSFNQASGGYLGQVFMNVLLPRMQMFSEQFIGAGLGTAGPEAIKLIPWVWLSHGETPEMGLVMWMIELGSIGAMLVSIAWLCVICRLGKLFFTSDRQLFLYVAGMTGIFIFKHLNTLLGPYYYIMFYWFTLGALAISLKARLCGFGTPYPIRPSKLSRRKNRV